MGNICLGGKKILFIESVRNLHRVRLGHFCSLLSVHSENILFFSVFYMKVVILPVKGQSLHIIPLSSMFKGIF